MKTFLTDSQLAPPPRTSPAQEVAFSWIPGSSGEVTGPCEADFLVVVEDCGVDVLDVVVAVVPKGTDADEGPGLLDVALVGAEVEVLVDVVVEVLVDVLVAVLVELVEVVLVGVEVGEVNVEVGDVVVDVVVGEVKVDVEDVDVVVLDVDVLVGVVEESVDVGEVKVDVGESVVDVLVEVPVIAAVATATELVMAAAADGASAATEAPPRSASGTATPTSRFFVARAVIEDPWVVVGPERGRSSRQVVEFGSRRCCGVRAGQRRIPGRKQPDSIIVEHS